jgi:hypothetical protein
MPASSRAIVIYRDQGSDESAKQIEGHQNSNTEWTRQVHEYDPRKGHKRQYVKEEIDTLVIRLRVKKMNVVSF